MKAIVRTVNGPRQFFQSAFPSQVAFSSCIDNRPVFRPYPIGMEAVIEGVQYLTITSTTHKKSTPSLTSSPGPPRTIKKAPSRDSIRPPATPAQSLALGTPSSTARITSTSVAVSNRPSSNGSPASNSPAFLNPGTIVSAILDSPSPKSATSSQAPPNRASSVIPAMPGGELSSTFNPNPAPHSLQPAHSPTAGMAPSHAQANPVSVIVSAVIGVASSNTAGSNLASLQQTNANSALGTTAVPAQLTAGPSISVLVVGHGGSQSFSTLNTPAVAKPIQAAGASATPDSQGQYTNAGQTVAPGSTIVVPGNTGAPATTIALVAIGVNQKAAIINGQTSFLTPPRDPTPIVIGSQTVQPDPKGQYVVSGSTLEPGATVVILGTAGTAPTTVGIQTNEGGQTEAIVNGQTSPLSPAPTAPPLYVGGHTIYPNVLSQYVVSGQKLVPGSTITIPGSNGAVSTTVVLTTVRAGQTVAVINGKTSMLSSPASPYSAAPININGQEIYPNPESEYVVAGKTLMPGTTITVPGLNGSPASIIALRINDAGHTEAVIDGQTSTLTPSIPVTAVALTVGGQTIIPNSAGYYVISGRTLKFDSTITIPGGSLRAFSTAIVLTTDAQGQPEALVNGQTATLTSTPITAAPLVLTPGGETLLPNAASVYLIDGSSLFLGGQPITISGASAGAPPTTLALQTDAAGLTEVIINDHTMPLTLLTSTRAAITIDSQTIAPNAAGAYVIDGRTLTLGGAVTLASTIVNLTTNTAGQTEVVGNGQTSLLSTSAATTEVGGYVMAGGSSGGRASNSGAERAGVWTLAIGLGTISGVLAIIL